MLGDKVYETSGKITSRRVLPNPGGSPKMEISIETAGKLLGVDSAETGTYWSEVRPDGTLFGEGQGIIVGKGGELATWVAQGVGTMKQDGAVSFRGAVYYQSSSRDWLRLNSVAIIYEYEAAAQGNTRTQAWEWK
jgi:hypothetical protein